MKNVLIIGALVLIFIIGFFGFTRVTDRAVQNEHIPTGEVVLETHEDTEVGFSFQYRTEPDGYTLLELPRDSYTDPAFVKLYTLAPTREYENFIQDTEASEGPPSIGIAVFENTQKQSASVWVDAHPSLSNMGLVTGDVARDEVVGGANAVRYTIDGLYRNDTVAIAHGGYIFLLSGAYLEEGSRIHEDFKTLVTSVTFIQQQ